MEKPHRVDVFAFTKFPVTIHWIHKGGRVQLVQEVLYPGKPKKGEKK